jgi:WD domain, G-beta repeat.
LTGHSNSITKVLITEDKQILSAGNDGNLFIWPFPLIKDCTKWIFSYNNSVFCIGNGGINEFDLLKMTHLRGLKFIFECVETKAYKNWFFSSTKSDVYKWNLESLTNEVVFTAKTVVTSLVLIQNWIVVSEGSKNVTVIDENNSVIFSFIYKDCIKVLCASDDGKLTCLLGINGIYLYDVTKNPEKGFVEGSFKFVKFNKNQLNLVSDDNNLTVYSIEDDCISLKVKLTEDTLLDILFLRKNSWFLLFFSNYYEVWDADSYSKISSGSLPTDSSSFFVTEDEQFIIQENISFFITEIRVN